jgi:uncharacterized protein (TIGR03000 family)
MTWFSKTRFLQLVVVAAAVVAVATSDAQARSRGGWGSYGGYGSMGSAGSYGGYGSYGSYGYTANYGSYGSYGGYGGSHGRAGLFARWHARKAARKSSSYGSYGSHGSYGGSYAVSYGGSSGSYGGYGSYGGWGTSGSYSGTSYYGGDYYDGGVIYESAPATEMAPMTAPADGAGPPPTPSPQLNPEGAKSPPEPSASAREAEIFVSLPEDAKVFVNDRPTTSVGGERHYISRGLQPGRTYSYKLRVEFQREGQPAVEDKLVRLQAGQTVKLAFGGEQAVEQQTAATELKLHVPADATVTLAGAATQQTGEVRTYASSLLKPGQKWDGYVVRVEVEQDGNTLVEERSLDIEGGKSYELAFEMKGETTQVAAK